MLKNPSELRSVCLVPYCPWPANTGTKVEMMKHLNVLRKLGPCRILSCKKKPVGFGWTSEAVKSLEEMGFEFAFRETDYFFDLRWIYSCGYAWLCTFLKMEDRFGSSNPYHRYAFRQSWIRRKTADADLVVMQYSYWARLLGDIPSVIVQHELLSNFHRGGSKKETQDLQQADCILVVGDDEVATLKERGLQNVIWSPPAIEGEALPVNAEVGLVGTVAPQNLEGLHWLESAQAEVAPKINVFGNLASKCTQPYLNPVGRYGKGSEPYEACGIHLMTRPDRPGLQIKVVEALSFGRAIIARKGSMRGLPHSENAWVEVETPDEMLSEALRLSTDEEARLVLANAARRYYLDHLDSHQILSRLEQTYLQIADKSLE